MTCLLFVKRYCHCWGSVRQVFIKQLAEKAREENISLNQLIVYHLDRGINHPLTSPRLKPGDSWVVPSNERKFTEISPCVPGLIWYLAKSLSPSCKIFLAVFTYRSWCWAQLGQVHSLKFNHTFQSQILYTDVWFLLISLVDMLWSEIIIYRSSKRKEEGDELVVNI